MKAHLIEEIIPMHYLGRNETGLPEHCFQIMYVLFVDGKETSGASELPAIRELAKAVYGLEGLEVKETVFAGFIREPQPRRPRERA